MDDDTFTRRLRTEVAHWIDEDIVTPEQGEAILAQPLRTRPDAPSAPTRRSADGDLSWTTVFLYLAAGVLIGAAALTLVLVGLEPDEPGLPLFIAGMALFVAGAATRFTLPRASLLPEALLVASLVPLTVSPADTPSTEVLGPAAMAIALVILVWRHGRAFMRPLPVVAFSVASGITFFEIFDDSQALPWVMSQALLLAGLVLLPKLLDHRPSVVATAAGVVAGAISFVAFLVDTLEVESSLLAEAIVGGAALALLGIGIALKDRGLALGAILVGCIDAIVFAFDVGGALVGTIVLLALAGALILQAEVLRKLLGPRATT